VLLNSDRENARLHGLNHPRAVIICRGARELLGGGGRGEGAAWWRRLPDAEKETMYELSGRLQFVHCGGVGERCETLGRARTAHRREEAPRRVHGATAAAGSSREG
jgi:hypothetical protein